MTGPTGILHEDVCPFVVTSCRTLLGMRNVSDKFVEKIKTHYTFSNVFSKIVPFIR
jgi:hypothetical protein